MTAVSAPVRTLLGGVASAVHAAWKATRDHQIAAWEGYLEVGALLLEARGQLPADKDYGRWFAEQGFGFSTQWGARLIRLAENRPAVLQAVESVLSTGQKPPGVDALLAATLPPARPKPKAEAEDDEDPLDDPKDVAGYDEHGAPLAWSDNDTAEHLYTVEFRDGRFFLKVPNPVTRARGDKPDQPRESIWSEAIRRPLHRTWTVAVREAGWPGFVQVANEIRDMILNDMVLREDWGRIPPHGAGREE